VRDFLYKGSDFWLVRLKGRSSNLSYWYHLDGNLCDGARAKRYIENPMLPVCVSIEMPTTTNDSNTTRLSSIYANDSLPTELE
jgi:hypothetical protein